ncbi:MAG: DALR domain-containing protein, partial [Polyangiaceae bacterium]
YTTRDALVAAAAGAEPELGNVLQGQAKVVEEAPIKVLAALDKDLNTPVALSVIGELAKAANEIVLQIAKLKKDKAAWDSARQLAAKAVLSLDGCCAPLGLMQASSEHYNTRSLKRRLKIRGLEEPAINAKVQARIEARGAKDFARADAIRAELTAIGVELLDASGGGTAWKIVA